jgi:hypothetical protein
VELIGRAAVNDCVNLCHLTFEEESHVCEVGGFAGSGLTSVRFPQSLSILAPGAFDHSRDLSFITFEDGSSIWKIEGLRRTNVRLLRFPESVAESPRFVQWAKGESGPFVDYSVRCLARMRRKAHLALGEHAIRAELDRNDIQHAVVRTVMHDASLKRTTESGFSNLRVVTNEDPQFHDSLALSVRVRIGQLPFAMKSPRSYTFTDFMGRNVTTIASVLAMLSFSSDFRCDPGRHCTKDGHFVFIAYCTKCGPQFSITIRCPRDAMNLCVTTQQCCGHFFAASIVPTDRRMPTIFLTCPAMRKIQGYAELHPLRVMVRILWRAGQLAAEQLAFIRSCLPLSTLMRSTTRTHRNDVSDFHDLFGELHGTFRLQLGPGRQIEPSVSFDSREIGTLIWLAPWAIGALRLVDYYELDCSFKALKPYGYSIPLAVRTNVGIPLGIVVTPSERREVFASFADLLAEKGFSHESLFELLLLSDAGTALRSYAEGRAGRQGYHRRHYLCYRHLRESLSSGTFVALLARRLLFTRTEDAFRELYPQTLTNCAVAF